MAHKAMREADGMRMLSHLLKDYSTEKSEVSDKIVSVHTRNEHGRATKTKPLVNK